jgi:predicted nucleotidyltransferase
MYGNSYFWRMPKSLSREFIVETLRAQKDLLHQKFYVKRIGLFGSYARNDFHANSDIDFLVELEAPLEIYIANRYALADYLQQLFGCEVDLANPKSLKPFYKDRILKQAVYA